jgi:hypothetical protein
LFRNAILWLAGMSLFLCLAAPLLYFVGRIDVSYYKTMLAAATAGWFVFATARAMRSSK